MEQAAGSYPFDSVSGYPAARIAAAWRRERPGTPVDSIEIVTPIWRLAKLLADDRRRVLREVGLDPATLDLLSVLRRAGPPYRLSTREIARRTLVTAGAISQRLARAERAGLVARSPAGDGSRSVIVSLTAAGHAVIERSVDRVLSREAEFVQSLGPAERAGLAAVLDRLLHDVASRVARAAGRPSPPGSADRAPAGRGGPDEDPHDDPDDGPAAAGGSR
ncbi:MAG TPA: MarR family transcriptional regulator [Streptosporangiaceae bacterium]|jgi:DNA-binding MarR family transcriptional regulator